MSQFPNNLSITTTVPRQTQSQDFGRVLKTSLSTAVANVSSVVGHLAGQLPGMGLVSAAVSSVASATSVNAATAGVVNVGGGTGVPTNPIAELGSNSPPAQMGDMMHQMRAEADRSIMVQMQMQQESREYNTLSNVLKTRHDSAKAAINNIR